MQFSSRTIYILGIITLLIVIAGAFLIFRSPTPDPRVNEDKRGWQPLTEQDLQTVRSLWEGPLQTIETDIPPNTGYTIWYIEDRVKEPRFEVIVEATTWEEFVFLEKQAFEEFRKRGANPCILPLFDAITVRVEDWRLFDQDSPYPNTSACP